MSLYLQANEAYSNVWWVLGAAIVLGIVYFLTRRAQNTQRAHEIGKNDPRQKVVNDSSYNINQEGIDGHRKGETTARQAERTTEQPREKGDLPNHK